MSVKTGRTRTNLEQNIVNLSNFHSVWLESLIYHRCVLFTAIFVGNVRNLPLMQCAFTVLLCNTEFIRHWKKSLSIEWCHCYLLCRVVCDWSSIFMGLKHIIETPSLDHYDVTPYLVHGRLWPELCHLESSCHFGKVLFRWYMVGLQIHFCWYMKHYDTSRKLRLFVLVNTV